MTATQPLADDLGWLGRLELGFECRSAGTVLKEVRHEGPLRVQRPFYPEGGLPHVYVLHPPGRVAGGDRLELDVRVGQGARALLTSPGSAKFYRSAGMSARVTQRLCVSSGASLEWFPQENIVFPGARVHCVSRVELDEDAGFIGWDMSCFGRPSNAEPFDHGNYYGRLEVSRGRKPILIESQRLVDEEGIRSAAGLRGHPMQAVFLATPCAEEHLDAVRARLESDASSFPIAATLIDGLLIVRALGHQAEELKRCLIPLWRTLRPLLLNRPAVAPRIWAT